MDRFQVGIVMHCDQEMVLRMHFQVMKVVCAADVATLTAIVTSDVMKLLQTCLPKKIPQLTLYSEV